MGGGTRKLGVILLQVLLQQSLAGGTILKEGVTVQGDEVLLHNPDQRMPTRPLEEYNCTTDNYCMGYFDKFFEAYQMDPEGHIVHKPYCEFTDDEDNSTSAPPMGVCTCGRDNSTGQDLCPSWTLTWSEDAVWYCGPCGRTGSQCDANNTCSYINSYCDTSSSINYCTCDYGGDFYELYYCYIPYYGYRMALQSTLIIGVVIAICLLIATAYNALGMRRIRRLQALGLWNRGNVTREAPPEDTPPKYDDVVEILPSYLDALQMEENVNGIVNTAFEEDGVSLPPSYEEIKSNFTKPVDKNKSNASHMQKESTDITNSYHTDQENKNESSTDENQKETMGANTEEPLSDAPRNVAILKEEVIQVQSQPIEQPIQNALQSVQL